MRQPDFQGVCSVSADVLESNAAYSKGLNLPSPKTTAGKLAVVGGGPSVKQHLVELKDWDGEIWGINGAAALLIEQGIGATLFTISPNKYPTEYLAGVDRAILSFNCDPWLFDSLKRADVSAFDIDGHGPTSVCAAMPLALKLGFAEVWLFGCEGSYGQETHAYQNTPSPADIVVRIGGTDFPTNIGYFMQTRLLASLVTGAPDFCKDRSGGMLAALADDPEGWDVIRLPSEMKAAA
jgi:hypothetical protein